MMPPHSYTRSQVIAVILAPLAIVTGPSRGVGGQRIDLTALSIEELMDIEVTTVSRKAVKLSEAAAGAAHKAVESTLHSRSIRVDD